MKSQDMPPPNTYDKNCLIGINWRDSDGVMHTTQVTGLELPSTDTAASMVAQAENVKGVTIIAVLLYNS